MSQQQPDPVGQGVDEERAHETGGVEPGTPPGMDAQDVEQRSQVARFLDATAFPGRREALVAAAERNQAPDVVLDLLRALPADLDFQNTQDVARAAGLGTEEQRT